MTPEERISKRRADMPSRYRKLYDRCMSGKGSPREAIKMQCLECWAWVQTETKLCDNYACPLFSYRPYKRPVKSPTERVQPPNSGELGGAG